MSANSARAASVLHAALARPPSRRKWRDRVFPPPPTRKKAAREGCHLFGTELLLRLPNRRTMMYGRLGFRCRPCARLLQQCALFHGHHEWRRNVGYRRTLKIEGVAFFWHGASRNRAGHGDGDVEIG